MNSTTSLIYFILFILAFILFHRRLSSCVSFQNWKATFTSPIFPATTHHLAKHYFVLGTTLLSEPDSMILYLQIKLKKIVTMT